MREEGAMNKANVANRERERERERERVNNRTGLPRLKPRNDLPQAVIASKAKQSSILITALAVLAIVVAFSIGFGFGNSASADPSPSSSGTSIPVKKGGTGSTTEQGALQNLLPDFATNNGKVLGSTGTEIGWVERTDAKSSNDIGKVKIDASDKTMSTNGDIGTNNTSKVSINRPDLWTVGVEYDFGNNLYGQRIIGYSTSASGGPRTPYQIIDIKSTTTKLIGSGGFAVLKNKDPNYIYQVAIPSGETFVSQDNTFGMVLDIAAGDRTDAPYDVWVIYKK
jgi:hypothetical protein